MLLHTSLAAGQSPINPAYGPSGDPVRNRPPAHGQAPALQPQRLRSSACPRAPAQLLRPSPWPGRWRAPAFAQRSNRRLSVREYAWPSAGRTADRIHRHLRASRHRRTQANREASQSRSKRSAGQQIFTVPCRQPRMPENRFMLCLRRKRGQSSLGARKHNGIAPQRASVGGAARRAT